MDIVNNEEETEENEAEEIVEPVLRDYIDLKTFAADNQNVHILATVNQTKEMVKRILAIPIPDSYKWNVYKISKTIGEIITECELGINAGRVAMDKYTLSDNIYEMGEGIYGRVLDGIWQYIKNSENKKDLCNILASELKDNVGQCLQGNLSRLCNVLVGYMEDIVQIENPNETLQREFALLMNIENIEERIKQGNAILDRLNITELDTRKVWLEPLL